MLYLEDVLGSMCWKREIFLGPMGRWRRCRMLNMLDKLYDAGDEKVRLLYKYRSCEPHQVACLRDDSLWFSTQPQLNDPFDCLIRLPHSIEAEDIHEVRSNLACAQPYQLALSDERQIAKYIGQSNALPPLVPLGVMATQLRHTRLLKHIQILNLNSVSWIRDLIAMANALVEEIFHNITVFCVAEPDDNQLMWAHYGASHRGFCTGYVCPTGIVNPALIHKVKYVKSPAKISAWQVISDPGSVHQDLTCTKPSVWSYEKEWRVTFGNMPGLLPELLPYREVILGARISRQNETSVRKAVGKRKVRLLRAVAETSRGQFNIRLEPA